MLAWSDAAKYAKAVFYNAFNDIDVFVEDTAKESKKVYLEILGRVFGGQISITQIFPIGSKPTVIKRCKHDQGVRNRRAIYIVDGDYDIALQAPLPPLKRLYRLKAYCIENYLLDPKAIVDVFSDESTDCDSIELSAKLDLLGWMRHFAPPMAKLLTALIAAHKYQCDGLPSVKFDLNKIQGCYHDYIDSAKVDALVDEYVKKIDSRGGHGSYAAIAAIARPAGVPDDKYVMRCCSGKYVLMPFLRSRLARKLTELPLEYPKLRVKLARRCDVTELSDIASVVA